MALDAHTIWDVAATGADANPGVDANGGGFNPANGSMDATGSATSANTGSPVFTGGPYAFVAGDVNARVFLQAGANVIPGWYPIVSVAGGNATLGAAIGAAPLYSQGGPYGLNTVAGCATVASPSSITWTVDYSHTGTCPYAFVDMVIDGTTNTKFTSAGKPVGKNLIGNIINVVSGTGFTVQLVEVVSTVTTTATCDKSLGTLSSTGGHGNLGGCLLTPGKAGANHIGGNKIFVKKATYSITSASSNVSNGVITIATGTATNWTRIVGYNLLPGDSPVGANRPTLQTNVASAMLITTNLQTALHFVILDGNSQTTSGAISNTVKDFHALWVTVKNMTGNGTSMQGMFFACDCTGCSTASLFFGTANPYLSCFYCVAWSNTCSGFAGGCIVLANCLSVNNTGASSDGFQNLDQSACNYLNCTARGNGRDGWRLTATSGGGELKTMINCVSYNNTGVGYNATGATEGIYLLNCFAGANSSGVSTNISNWQQMIWTAGVFAQGVTNLTADPHTNAAGGDYSPNNTAGGGALLRGNVGLVGAFPGISTTNYQDAGSAQHQDSGGGSVTNIMRSPRRHFIPAVVIRRNVTRLIPGAAVNTTTYVPIKSLLVRQVPGPVRRRTAGVIPERLAATPIIVARNRERAARVVTRQRAALIAGQNTTTTITVPVLQRSVRQAPPQRRNRTNVVIPLAPQPLILTRPRKISYVQPMVRRARVSFPASPITVNTSVVISPVRKVR